jgi:2-C-methyl-D-erythritol 4-phosphate cytidylyltransferase
MYKYAIIVAGGSGSRIGGELPKQFQLLKDRPVLWHTLNAFTRAYDDIQLILVLPEAHIRNGEEIARTFSPHRIRVTCGGETRFDSVRNGLQLVDTHSVVLVHDAVRCLVSPELIRRCASAAMEKGNAIPAIRATDTIRIESADGNESIPREQVHIIQTPQAFLSDILKQAFEQPFQPSFTDEANVVSNTGVKINLIEGESTNIKITRPMDFQVAEMLMEDRKDA